MLTGKACLFPEARKLELLSHRYHAYPYLYNFTFILMLFSCKVYTYLLVVCNYYILWSDNQLQIELSLEMNLM